MSQATTIEWTNSTWNPTRGCSRVSEGCRHCYAERMAARFSKPGQPFDGIAHMTSQGPRWTGKVVLAENHLKLPLGWRKPRRVFVNSMSDLFHERLDWADIDKVFAVMAMTPRHQFQVLTKRPDVMRAYTTDPMTPYRINRAALEIGSEHLVYEFPAPNIWLGTSVEDQQTADTRIPALLNVPAAVRFLSLEPLIGPVDISAWAELPDSIHWAIVGAESGPGARPCKESWIRSLRDQCVANGVAFFLKQLVRRKRVIGTPKLDGRRWTQFPKKLVRAAVS